MISKPIVTGPEQGSRCRNKLDINVLSEVMLNSINEMIAWIQGNESNQTSPQ